MRRLHVMVVRCLLAATLALPLAAHAPGGHEPIRVSLTAAAQAAAMAEDGTMFLVGTADGITGIRLTGEVAFESLEGHDIRSVAVAGSGGLVAAGSASGRLFILDDNGDLVAEAATVAAVTSLAMSEDGSTVAVGLETGAVHAYRPYETVLSGLPGEDEVAVMRPAWSYETNDGAVLAVRITADGQWVGAGNGTAWSWQNDSALVPGNRAAVCADTGPPLGPNCPSYVLDTPGVGVTSLAVGESSYDLVAGFENGWMTAVRVDNFFVNSWNFDAGAPVASMRLSDGADHIVVANGEGLVQFLDTLPGKAEEKRPQWTYDLGVDVADLAISPSDDLVAVATTDGRIDVIDGHVPDGTPATLAWVFTAEARPMGLTFSPDGVLAAAAGSEALFWPASSTSA